MPNCKSGPNRSFLGNTKRQVAKTASLEKKRPQQKLSVKYSCPHCNFETTNIVRHFTHKRQHREENQTLSSHSFKCNNCNYTTKIKGGLQRHIKRVHTKERPFTCPVCNFRAIDKPSMAKHIVKMHKEDVGADVEMYVNCLKAGPSLIDENSGADSDSNDNEGKGTHARNCSDDIKSSSNKFLVSAEENSNSESTAAAVNTNVKLDFDVKDNQTAIKDARKFAGEESILNESNSTVAERQEEKCKKMTDGDERNENCNELFDGNSIQIGKRSSARVRSMSKASQNNVNTVKTPSVRRGSIDKRRSESKKYSNIYCTPEYREMRARKLTCECCQRVCASRREFLAHMNEHKDSGIHCPICWVVIIDSNERSRHVKNHVEDNPFVCATCLCTFAKENEIVVHQQQEHKKTINVIMECMFCPFNSRSQERYTRHMTRCHMFGSKIPTYNPFDVNGMKKILLEEGWIQADEVEISTVGKGDYSIPTCKDESKNNMSLCESSDCLEEGNGEKLMSDESVEEHTNLDYSLLDISTELNDSHIDELLEESNHFDGFSNNDVEMANVDKTYNECTKRVSTQAGKTSSRIAISQQSNLFSNKQSISKLTNSCNLSAGDNLDSASNSRFDTSFNSSEHLNEVHTSNVSSLTYARISSIASAMGIKGKTISDMNVKKMSLRKAQVRNMNRNSKIQRSFPSPDSTSGSK